MQRVSWFILIAAALWFVAVAGTRAETALNAETMKVALHTSTAEENGFIDYVLAKVDAGTLPMEMVESTFLWAKRKSRYKFQYFKRGLQWRAEQAGIDL